MFLTRTLFISSLLCTTLIFSSCTAKTQFRSSCASESDAAWNELSIAKAKGLAGTLSYTKALSLLTAAKTMQGVENFDACYRDAKKAREYIRNSMQGQ
jgi:hypothetical protein